ncbi:protein phosphatase 1 regulatory subunit 3D, partial [Fukomys damarensis]|uniref:protein phosphatase 1 regulatory subunit 3D n=1 Tax=Fukomys damarensis TaxID=885580 RepID=UPI00053F6144
LGLELAQVRVFNAGDDPSVPLHVLSRLAINADLCCSSQDLEFTLHCLVPDFPPPIEAADFAERLAILIPKHYLTCENMILIGCIYAQGSEDVFAFGFPVPPFLLELGSRVHFAVRYRVAGAEYWDNNGGRDYSLTCRDHALHMPRGECEESWIHFI